MERRNLLAGLLVLVLSSFMLAGTAFASPQPQSSTSNTCSIKSLPSFMDQGFGTKQASSIADVVEVECAPVYAEQSVKVSSQELYNSCANHLSWTAIGNAANPYKSVEGPSIGKVKLDDDGNATVVAWGGPSCAATTSIISAHMEQAPGESVSTTFTVLAPETTSPGVWAFPKEQVEVGDYSNTATIVGVEFPAAFSEKSVAISDEQLYSHCGGKLQWVGPDETALGKGEGVTVKLDDNGNAFVVALGGPSCAAGETEVEASLEKAPYTTYTSTFNVLPPKPTFP
jgi:hypothetical protein